MKLAATADPTPRALDKSRPVRVISPRPPGTLQRLGDVWRFRRVLRLFWQQNIQRMYLNTWLGRIWIPLRPSAGLIAQVVVFGGVLGAPSDGIPYFLFLAVGAGAWQLLDLGWYMGTRSLEVQRRYIRRIYFPRLIAIVAALALPMVRFTVFLGMATIGLGYFWAKDGVIHLKFGLGLLEFAAGISAICLIAMSLSMFTSIYSAHARDPRFIVRFICNFWMLATPVIYPLSALPDGAETAMQLNPMTAPMEMVREGLFGAGTVELTGVLITSGFILVVGYLGLRFFARSEVLALDYL